MIADLWCLATKMSPLSYNKKDLEEKGITIPLLGCHGCQHSFINNTDAIRVRTIRITSNEIYLEYTQFESGKKNRFIHHYGTENVVLLSFENKLKNTFVQKVLSQPIRIYGDEYNFLGCSNNGLKQRKCYLYKETPEGCEKILSAIGNFNNIGEVSKRITRIGLLFSMVSIIEVEQNLLEEQILADITTGDYNFTDGCGQIGKGLAKFIAKHLHIQQKISGTNDTFRSPSVFQIRYKGYKGVVALNHRIPKNALVFRPSMKKFECTPCEDTKSLVLGVADYSRPYTFGHLNRQFIMLLSGCGVKKEVFLKKQTDYFDQLNNMLAKKDDAIDIAFWENRIRLAEAINSSNDNEVMAAHKKELRSLQSSLITKMAAKLRIIIKNSRNVFGVCDPLGVLEYGQCFFRPTIRGKPKTINGFVVLCKNPCYLLGDVRILKAIDSSENPRISELEKENDLVDCIVFPTNGHRPHPSETAGSDLDGDMYFVCWDADLIPPSCHEPYSYPSGNSKQIGEVTREKMIAYFSRQNRSQYLVAKVNSLYNKWANRKGVSCMECEELGKLFARAIDSSKTGEIIDIPQYLTSVNDETELATEVQLWQEMEKRANEFEIEYQHKTVSQAFSLDVSEEFVTALLSNNLANVDENIIYRFAVNWVHMNITDINEREKTLRKFWDLIDFGRFSSNEIDSVIKDGVPLAIALNALNKSKLLDEGMRQYFFLHLPQNRWRHYVTESYDEFNWDHLVKALTTFSQSMVIVKIPVSSAVIVLHFQQKCTLGRKQAVRARNTISSYLFSDVIKIPRKFSITEEYLVDLTNDVLQIYKQVVQRSFFFLKKDSGTDLRRQASDIPAEIISVDLTSFKENIIRTDRHPTINKMQFHSIEIFVQSGNMQVNYFPSEIIEQSDVYVTEESETNEQEDGDSDSEREEMGNEYVTIDSLYEASISANVHKFAFLLNQKMQDGENYKDTIMCLMNLCDSLLLRYSHKQLDEDKLREIIAIISTLISKVKKPENVLRLISMLTKFNCLDYAKQILARIINDEPSKQATSQELLQVYKQWTQWYDMEEDVGKTLTNYFYESYLSTKDEDNHKELNELLDYMAYQSGLEVCAFLQETKQQKEKINTTQSSNTGECLQGYRVTKIEKKENKGEDNDALANVRYLIHLSSTATYPPSKINKGSWVSFMRVRDYNNNKAGWRSYACLAKVEEAQLKNTSVTLISYGPLPNILQKCEVKQKNWKWRIDLVGNITAFDRIFFALDKLNNFPTSTTQLIKYICSPEKLTVNENEDKQNLHETPFTVLNDAQKKAVSAAINQKITLIHGPPGTGKTTVACECIKQMCKLLYTANQSHKGRILVTAETNIAVDNLTRGLLSKDISVVRMGNISQISKEFHYTSLDNKIETICDREAKKTEIRDQNGIIRRNIRLAKKVIQSSDVVCATCVGAGDNLFAAAEITFDYVLIDEATMVTEPTSLCTLIWGAKKLVLIGDPKQLAPTTVLACSEKNSNEGILTTSALTKTIFHKFYESHEFEVIFLNKQHRMHRELCKFPSETFYNGELQSDQSVDNRVAPDFPWPDINRPLCFLHVDGKEIRRGNSFTNTSEAQAVIQIIKCLVKNACTWMSIGVLTLYAGQRDEIKSGLKNEKVDNIEVSTVDGFQGREKDIIIVSTVRTSSLGFTDDPARVNVLLTRARNGLIIVGNKNTLLHSNLWKAWINQAPEIHANNLLNSYSVSQTHNNLLTRHEGQTAFQPHNKQHRNDGSRKSKNYGNHNRRNNRH